MLKNKKPSDNWKSYSHAYRNTPGYKALSGRTHEENKQIIVYRRKKKKEKKQCQRGEHMNKYER